MPHKVWQWEDVKHFISKSALVINVAIQLEQKNIFFYKLEIIFWIQ